MTEYFRTTFTATLPDGTKKRIFVRAKTEKELAKKLAVKQYEYEHGLVVLNNKTPFSVWAEEWLETYKKGKVGNSHYKQISGLIQNLYLPCFGNRSLGEIKTIHLQQCLNTLSGKSNSYIHKAQTYLKDIFEKAVQNKLIVSNPANGLVPPIGTTGHRRSLTEEEKTAFFKAIKDHPKGAFFGIMLACGLRPAEARALTWFNVDIKKKTINVTQAIEHDTKNSVKEPKTAAGKRSIPIPDWYMEILHKIERTDSPYVFPNTKGEPLTIDKYRKGWKSLLRTMDIAAGAKTYRNKVVISVLDQNITPYYLRHTYATELAEKGVDIKTAQYLLGHSDIKMTLQVYTHVTNKMLDEARIKINNCTPSVSSM